MSHCLITLDAFTGLVKMLKKNGINPSEAVVEASTVEIQNYNNGDFIALKIFSNLLDHASLSNKDRSLAWRYGSEFDLSIFGDLLLKGKSLGESLTNCSQFFRLIKNWAYVDLEIQENIAIIKYKVLDREYWPRHSDAEFTLSLFLSLIEFYVSKKIYIKSISFETAETPIGSYIASKYRCEVLFNQSSNQIIFPSSYLDHELRTPPEENHSLYIKKYLATDIDNIIKKSTFSELVRYEIFKNMESLNIDQQAIACALNMSRRSLRRNLFFEGSTFKEQVEYCRSTLAKSALNYSTLPFAEIAFRLGYSDQSAFSRACIRWFNMTPAVARVYCNKNSE